MGLISTSTFILVGLCCVVNSRHIEDHAIYKIANKDGGVLTVVNSSGTEDDIKIKVKDWNDAAGQKWKAKQPLLAKSFEFKPTSNEHARLDADKLSSNIFARPSSENTKYWYVKDMAEGVFQIKNYQTENCISSQGLNKPVKLRTCDNNSSQQWSFIQL